MVEERESKRDNPAQLTSQPYHKSLSRLPRKTQRTTNRLFRDLASFSTVWTRATTRNGEATWSKSTLKTLSFTRKKSLMRSKPSLEDCAPKIARSTMKKSNRTTLRHWRATTTPRQGRRPEKTSWRMRWRTPLRSCPSISSPTSHRRSYPAKCRFWVHSPLPGSSLLWTCLPLFNREAVIFKRWKTRQKS